jgi:hypothetical protein
MAEKDTSSLITTGPRTSVVFDDNDDFAGGVQVFGAERETEAAAIAAIANPQTDDDADDDALVAAMLEKDMVWCHGRCQSFKHKSLFSVDERNTGRLECKSYCKQCEAARFHGKYAAQRQTQATMRYEYRQRKDKKRKGRG